MRIGYYYKYPGCSKRIGKKHDMKPPSPKHRLRSSAPFRLAPAATEAEPYEDRLDREREWAMSEGSKFFQGTSEVHLTLKRITQKLGELGIDYVVVGGMAMFQHGYRRFTEDVDILVPQRRSPRPFSCCPVRREVRRPATAKNAQGNFLAAISPSLHQSRSA